MFVLSPDVSGSGATSLYFLFLEESAYSQATLEASRRDLIVSLAELQVCPREVNYPTILDLDPELYAMAREDAAALTLQRAFRQNRVRRQQHAQIHRRKHRARREDRIELPMGCSLHW